MGMTDTASRIIAQFGQEGVFVRAGEPDESTYPPTPGVTTYHPATLAVVDYAQEDRDGTNIQDNDLRALVSIEGLGIVPTNSESLTVAGKTFSVERVVPLAPDSVTRFYDIRVRGA